MRVRGVAGSKGNDMSDDGLSRQGGALASTLGLAGTASTVVGLAADFAQPFAPIALYLLLVAGGLTLLIGLFYVLMVALRPRLRSPFVYLGVLTLICGVMVFFQQMTGAEGEERGGLASLVAPLAKLQDDLGIVKQDIAAIKESSQRTAVASERTAKAVEDVAKGVEGLGKLGGLIDDPRTVTDFYNNALVYERRGDALSARRMYEQAIGQQSDAIDLHQRYAALLKAQEGLPGAREIYADLARSQPANRAVALQKALLQPGELQEAALRALLDAAEPYAPAWYEVSRLHSADRLGQQSLADKRAEKEALEAFEAADKAGGIYRHFLEKESAERWRESVAARLAAYRTSAVDSSPVSISAMPSNSGWTISVNLAEPARAIRYAIDGGAAADTGLLDYVNQATGGKQPRNFFQLPLSVRTAAIDIWYDDVQGKPQGPFRQAFDAAVAHVANTRNILENVTPEWVSGRDFDGKFLVYFSHLMSYRCGIREIAYGIDRPTPDKTWPLPPCDFANPFSVGDDAKLYESFPQKIGSLSMQLTYADGTKSPLKTFSF